MQIRWKSNATRDLEEILYYIWERNPIASDKLAALVDRATESLLDMPYQAPRGRVPNTREKLVLPNYILVYSVGAEYIDILGVLHTRKKYP